MSEYLKFAHELADASGKVIRKYFRSKMTVENKADDSPVTVADRLTETIMREMISKKFLDDQKPTGMIGTLVFFAILITPSDTFSFGPRGPSGVIPI